MLVLVVLFDLDDRWKRGGWDLQCKVCLILLGVEKFEDSGRSGLLVFGFVFDFFQWCGVSFPCTPYCGRRGMVQLEEWYYFP